MDGLPTFSDATDAATDVADAVRDHARTLLPWLPDPPECPQCGALMYADVTFDPKMVEHVNCWTCRNCDAPDRYREDPDVDDPEPPREGAPVLREVFDK
jgi:RNase P subunit RPR2